MSEKCKYCNMIHDGVCPRVSALEYDANGNLIRVEFHNPAVNIRSDKSLWEEVFGRKA